MVMGRPDSRIDATLALELGERKVSSLPAQATETTFLDAYPPPD